jgi:hypothetical protein
MNATNLVSIGKAAGALNRLPEQIREAALAVGVAPKFKIDGKDYFDAADVDRISAFFREQQLEGCGLAARANNLS